MLDLFDRSARRRTVILTAIAAAAFCGCTDTPALRAEGRSKLDVVPGLLAAYGFSEGTGTVTANASGTGINGTLIGATWTTGKNDGGLSFNGSSSYVNLGSAPALAVTGSLSVSAWVNESGNVADDGNIVSRSNGAGGWELKSSPDTGSRTFAFGVYNSGGGYVARYSRTVRALNTWYHVAGVYDASARTLHIYVNGNLDDGALWGSVPGSISTASVNASIGRRAAGYFIKGVLDDVRVYGRALSQAEIQSDMSTAVTAPRAPADTAAPVVSLVSPRADATVAGTSVGVSATATDDVGVVGVQFLLDGAALGAEDTVSPWGIAWNTTAVAPGPHQLSARARDAAGNVGVAVPVNVVVDNQPPAIASVSAGGISDTSATITWTTDEPATSQVEYGTTTSYGTSTHVDSTLTTAHRMDLSGLTPGAAYDFRVRSADVAGNEAVSGNATFTTSGSTAADTTPPTVPSGLSARAVSNSAIDVTWTASSDDVGVTGYDVFRDGARVASVADPRFSDTGLAAATTYSYAVAAHDAAGNVSAQSAPATATTPPVLVAGTPTLVQHIASSTNPIGISGNAGNNFRFSLPNPVGAGNCLVLGISYGWSASRTVSITDDNGNVWPATPAVTVTDRGNLISSIFVLPNAHPGPTQVTVHFDSSLYNFQYALSEFYGVATASPVNGTSASSSTATIKGTTTLSSGSFTPAQNNDAAGGNLIWTYFASNSDGSSHTVTNWSAGPGFQSLHSDIGWHDQGMPTASQYAVQATQGTINPSISVTATGADTYNAVSVALKAAPAGTAPSRDGIRIVRQNISSLGNFSGVTSWTVQFPCVGNLLVLTTPQASVMKTTSVTDTAGNLWVKYAPDNEDPQIWYVANATPDPNLKITFHMSSAPTGAQSALMYDIVGADANPVDARGEKLNATVTSSHLVDSPVITPGSANGLTIAAVTLGQGPISQLDSGAPPGAVFDYVYYSNEIDTDLMDNADGRAHFYNTDTTTEHWNWLLVGPTSNNNYASVALHFRSAPPQAQATISAPAPAGGRTVP